MQTKEEVCKQQSTASERRHSLGKLTVQKDRCAGDLTAA